MRAPHACRTIPRAVEVSESSRRRVVNATTQNSGLMLCCDAEPRVFAFLSASRDMAAMPESADLASRCWRGTARQELSPRACQCYNSARELPCRCCAAKPRDIFFFCSACAATWRLRAPTSVLGKPPTLRAGQPMDHRELLKFYRFELVLSARGGAQRKRGGEVVRARLAVDLASLPTMFSKFVNRPRCVSTDSSRHECPC